MHIRDIDVIVIGGGHAGCEAAAAAARVGAKTLLITNNIATIGEMSCNPAIGGIAKGTIAREIDALDGLMGVVIDKSSIHSRILNYSKGPAVWGPRAQADRALYRQNMQDIILNYQNLEVLEDSVQSLIIESNVLCGIIAERIGKINVKKVILTAGTFLRGVMHIGTKQIPAGRINEKPSLGLSEILLKYNFKLSRMKTGAPPRLDCNSINWQTLERHVGDNPPQPFSFLHKKIMVPQVDCYITHTNQVTHDLVSQNINKSAVYAGNMKGKGPRYCPSIEEKVVKFPERKQHQIFLEPEGLKSNVVYPNGIGMSLPQEIQEVVIRSVKGLEQTKILQYGYKIEYDYVDPRELYCTLETKKISGLYFAGQINGSTGYEEAGGQGLIAGTNAALSLCASGKNFIVGRSESYIGVMIDDLTIMGTNDEPYRMFTSRSEYRLSLRSDNADMRLTEKGYSYGLVSEQRFRLLQEKKSQIEKLKLGLNERVVTPNELKKCGISISQDGVKRNYLELLGYHGITLQTLEKLAGENLSVDYSHEVRQQVEIEAMYKPYLNRQKADIKLFREEENIVIPDYIDYFLLKSLSSEVREKLNSIKPKTIGAAKRIPGITPAAITCILVYLNKSKHELLA